MTKTEEIKRANYLINALRQDMLVNKKDNVDIDDQEYFLEGEHSEVKKTVVAYFNSTAFSMWRQRTISERKN